MANNAMKLTKDNLDFVERFDSVLVRVHNEWLKCLWDFAESRKISLYVVLAYRFEDMKFVHESTTIMDSSSSRKTSLVTPRSCCETTSKSEWVGVLRGPCSSFVFR